MLLSQSSTEATVDTTKIYDIAEIPPSFSGGENALMTYIARTIRYPVIAQEFKVMGKIIVVFVVDRNGVIKDVHIENSLTKFLAPKCQLTSNNKRKRQKQEEYARSIENAKLALMIESLRVIKSMPNWIPGKFSGQNVICKFFVPINFKLQ
ncbi:MAG: hypothetical protein QM751_13375 [Paludibacteraceae bacterium]